MEMSAGARAARTGLRRARVRILLEVLAAVGLALVAVVLVTWISERRGFRARFDLTSDGENTFDPVSIAVIRQLPEDARIDQFFRPLEPPLTLEGIKVQDRVRRLLRRAVDESGGHLVLEDHDLSDPGKLPARTLQRMSELKLAAIEPGGLVVVTSGARRKVLRLRPDLVDIDPGQPDPRRGQYVPPRVVNFMAEEALMSALLEVSRGEAPHFLFTQGHGEPDPKATDPLGLAALANELEGDGFVVGTWESSRAAALPEDCDVLAILGPEQAFTSAELTEIRRFVESGGRLLAAPGTRSIDGPDSLKALLASFGIDLDVRGCVARPLPSATGSLQVGLPECGILAIGPEGMPALNPITEPIRRAERGVQLLNSRVLKRGDAPTGGRVLDLLFVADGAWHELPAAMGDGRYDWVPSETEPTGRFTVAMTSAFPPSRDVRARFAGTSTSRPECRVVAVGSRETFLNVIVPTNRDFLLNAANWLASREYRVKVSKNDPATRRIDVNSESGLARVTWIAMGCLPLLFALTGIVTVWRRNRR